MNLQRELLKDPEYRKAMQAQLRVNQTQNYPDLAEELGLTAEEANKLFDLLTEAEERADRTTSALRFDIEWLAGRVLTAVRGSPPPWQPSFPKVKSS